MTAGRCTCNPPHSARVHRRGIGRCLVRGCTCMFPPRAATAPTRRSELASGLRGTADDAGIVLTVERVVPARRQRQPSPLETKLWRKLEEQGVRLPDELEYQFALSIGRRYRADAFYRPDLLVEVDGGTFAPGPGRHNTGSGFEEDCRKLSTAAALGYRVVRVTGAMIRNGDAIKLIRDALAWKAVAS